MMTAACGSKPRALARVDGWAEERGGGGGEEGERMKGRRKKGRAAGRERETSWGGWVRLREAEAEGGHFFGLFGAHPHVSPESRLLNHHNSSSIFPSSPSQPFFVTPRCTPGDRSHTR
jgi:hypothetical protein